MTTDTGSTRTPSAVQRLATAMGWENVPEISPEQRAEFAAERRRVDEETARAIADVEAHVRAGASGWEAILLTEGVRSLSLAEHAAHQARAMRGAVVTTKPA